MTKVCTHSRDKNVAIRQLGAAEALPQAMQQGKVRDAVPIRISRPRAVFSPCCARSRVRKYNHLTGLGDGPDTRHRRIADTHPGPPAISASSLLYPCRGKPKNAGSSQ